MSKDMTENEPHWLSVAEYAKKKGWSRARVYQDIVYKRIPEKRVRKVEFVKKRFEILDE